MEIKIYTDGACAGNPGPMGIGAIILQENSEKTISKYIGHGTNNIAEISAVIEALKSINEIQNKNITVYTDSQLIVGYLNSGWKVNKNIELVNEMKNLTKKCGKFKIVKVKGHSNNKYNNIADRLAIGALKGM